MGRFAGARSLESGYKDWRSAYAVSRDGTLIAREQGNGIAIEHDGRILTRIENLPAVVTALDFHPEGGLLLAVAKEVFLLYDLNSRKPFAKSVAEKNPKVARDLFKLALKDAKGGIPRWVKGLANRQADAPGCSDLAARK